MKILGYASVFSSEQSLALQVQRLKAEGALENMIFYDKTSCSGVNSPGLHNLQLTVEVGDLILITKLDRLGRDTCDMVRLIKDFDKMGVGVKFLDDGISTEGSTGRSVINILSAIANAQKVSRLELAHEGRLDAKNRGIKFGRKPSINRKILIKMHQAGYASSEIAKFLKIAKSTVHKILNDLNLN